MASINSPMGRLIVEFPYRGAALRPFAIASNQVGSPRGLKALVKLRVGVVRIVDDVHGLRRTGRRVDDAVAGALAKGMVYRVGVLRALLAVLGHVEAGHFLARLGKPAQDGRRHHHLPAAHPRLIREQIEGRPVRQLRGIHAGIGPHLVVPVVGEVVHVELPVVGAGAVATPAPRRGADIESRRRGERRTLRSGAAAQIPVKVNPVNIRRNGVPPGGDIHGERRPCNCANPATTETKPRKADGIDFIFRFS
jgi:hypothetical protein